MTPVMFTIQCVGTFKILTNIYTFYYNIVYIITGVFFFFFFETDKKLRTYIEKKNIVFNIGILKICWMCKIKSG